MTPVVRDLKSLALRGDEARPATRALPEEVPVALCFQGATQAVMMATPADLEDFARGFAVSEGIVGRDEPFERLEIVPRDEGLEVQCWLGQASGAALRERRRSMLGPVGCGLCGIDSLREALRPLAPVASPARFTHHHLNAAIRGLPRAQVLNLRARSLHAAGFFRPEDGLLLAREDVGRHNALDKLIGALVRQGIDPGSGIVVMTSRVSVDLVQKCVAAGVPVLIAVSAPTALAVRTAEAAGLTLAAMADGAGFDLFAHPERIEAGRMAAGTEVLCDAR